jgi:hypothetical protein
MANNCTDSIFGEFGAYATININDPNKFYQTWDNMINESPYIKIRFTRNPDEFICRSVSAYGDKPIHIDEDSIKLAFGKNIESIVSGIYDVRYILPFIKHASTGSNITICTRNNYPLCIKEPSGVSYYTSLIKNEIEDNMDDNIANITISI